MKYITVNVSTNIKENNSIKVWWKCIDHTTDDEYIHLYNNLKFRNYFPAENQLERNRKVMNSKDRILLDSIMLACQRETKHKERNFVHDEKTKPF